MPSSGPEKLAIIPNPHLRSSPRFTTAEPDLMFFSTTAYAAPSAVPWSHLLLVSRPQSISIASLALSTPRGFSHSWQTVTCIENHDIVKVGSDQRIPYLSDSSNRRSWYAQPHAVRDGNSAYRTRHSAALHGAGFPGRQAMELECHVCQSSLVGWLEHGSRPRDGESSSL